VLLAIGGQPPESDGVATWEPGSEQPAVVAERERTGGAGSTIGTGLRSRESTGQSRTAWSLLEVASHLLSGLNWATRHLVGMG